MTQPSKVDSLAQRGQPALEAGSKYLWQTVLVSALMDRLPLHCTLRDELIGDLRVRGEMEDNPVIKAGLQEAVRHLISL